MNEIANLIELPPTNTLGVIINCGTKWVTTLALLSTLRNTDCPVLVINCESRDGSREHFQRLCSTMGLGISWLEWPLRPHHVALDQLFSEIPADRVLLVDSDVEILSRRPVAAMSDLLSADSNAYGAGLLHGPESVGAAHGLHANAGYYMERMWIPLTLLRTDAIRKALKENLSFGGGRVFQDLPGFPRLARLLGYRYRFPFLRRIRLPIRWRGPSSNEADSAKTLASYLDFDTGAALHEALLTRGHRFAALPAERWNDVRHFHGITRTAVSTPLVRVAGQLGMAITETDRSERSVLQIVKSRLQSEYDFST